MEDIDLGFAEPCESEWLTNVYFPSKLGGKPAWLHLGELPTNESLKCSKCHNQKSFLCQIYAPFDNEYNFHRMIYVFICRTESCYVANKNDNITILRSQLPLHNEFYSDTPPPEDDAVPGVLPTKFKLCIACGCLGPLKCSRCKKAFYCGSQHQRLHWPNHKVSCSFKNPAAVEVENKHVTQILFPEWEIDMDSVKNEEKIDLKLNVNEMDELQKLEQLEVSGKAGCLQNLVGSEIEKYAHGSDEKEDKYFRKFRKECEKSSLQIIRYKRNGHVLWISDPECTVNEQLKNIPKCELCCEDRAFEFQIMPQMLNYLKDSNIDWGVIAVYTCPNSCPLPKEKGYVEEFCIKQDITNSN